MSICKINPFCQEDFFEILSRLIAIPSVKGPPLHDAPYGRFPADALIFLLNICKENAFLVQNLDHRIGFAQWGAGKDMIAIATHLDVVPPGAGWDSDPFTLLRKNGQLIGRGVSDNKGPAIASLFALLRLRASGYVPPCRIRLIFGTDEEHGCSCMEHYVKTEELPTRGFTPDASFPAIFAEKGLLQLRLSGAGSDIWEADGGDAYNVVPSSCQIKDKKMNLDYAATGLPAHASTPEQGKNAIYTAIAKIEKRRTESAPVLSFVAENLLTSSKRNKLITCAPKDISGSFTVNTGRIHIDSDESFVGLDIRYPVHTNGDFVFEEIQQKARIFGLKTEIIHLIPPLYTDPQSASMTALRSAYSLFYEEAYFSTHPDQTHMPEIYRSSDPIAIGGATYARSLPGIVAFGPMFPWDESTMHQKNESCSESQILLSIKLYQQAIQNLCETHDS